MRDEQRSLRSLAAIWFEDNWKMQRGGARWLRKHRSGMNNLKNGKQENLYSSLEQRTARGHD
jgi:hypothetical protein